jgi:hypothetical protein
MTIYTQVVTTEESSLTTVKSPSLLLAPVEYQQKYTDDLNNVLRLYFNQIDTLVSQLRLGALNTLALPYGAFQDNTSQTVAAINTGTVMTFNTTDFSNGVSVVTSGGKASRITATTAGIYNFQWSGQFQNADNAQHDISVWIRKNGADIAGSTGYISIPARKSAGAGNEGHGIFGWNYFISFNAGDYIELWWSTTNTQVTIETYPAVTTPPAAVKPFTASLVATMAFVSALP